MAANDTLAVKLETVRMSMKVPLLMFDEGCTWHWRIDLRSPPYEMCDPHVG